MPVVLRERGYAFYFYAGEGNEPPHVPVKKGSGRLKLWLRDLSVASTRNMKPAEIREALKIARTHAKLLHNAWHDFFLRKD